MRPVTITIRIDSPLQFPRFERRARGKVASDSRCRNEHRRHPERRRRWRSTQRLRQREYRQRAAELGVITQFLVATHGTEAVLVLLETRRHADAGPAADAREDAHVLLALVLVREHVADDAGRRLELEQVLVDVVGVDALQVALERAVADHAAALLAPFAPPRPPR